MHNIHLISHTHWDREWYLPFQVYRIKLIRLMDKLLDLLESDPNYKHFTLDGQTIILEDYLRIRPEREEDLRGLVQNGRILIGPWHILPDEFLVSQEALVRNLLIGDQVARRFGPKMEVGYIPDPFGHIGQMPQILNGFGISTACVQRGLSDEPVEFWWQSPDGSRVLMSYLRDGYGNAAGLPTSDPDRFVEEVRRLRDSLLAASVFAEEGPILLMQGTDHVEPQPDTSAALAYANNKLEDTQLIHSSLPAYFQEVQQFLNRHPVSLPVVHGELRDCRRHNLLPGVLSTRIWIKQRNHFCQTILEKWAEPFSTWARLAAARQKDQPVDLHRAGAASLWLADPQAVLREAWKTLLECHPHDSICGCSIDQVHEEMRPRFDQVEQIGEEITRQSLEILAESVDTTPPAPLLASNQKPFQALIVFNPLSNPQTGPVLATVEQPKGVTDFEIVDESGGVLPHQSTGLESRELVNLVIHRTEAMNALALVAEARGAGMYVLDTHIQQADQQVQVEVILAENGQINQRAWDQSLQELRRFAVDPSIETFHVLARTTPSREVLFVAPEVPGPGLRTFWARPKPDGTGPAPATDRPSLDDSIENEFFRVHASTKDGTLSLVDLQRGTVYTGLNRFEDGGDCGDEYNYCPPANDRPAVVQSVEVRVERGNVQQTIEVRLELFVPSGLAPDRQSRRPEMRLMPIVTRATLYPGVSRVDIETTVENQAEDHRLRVHFPTPFTAQEAWLDGHYEVVRRPIEKTLQQEDWPEQPRPERPQRAFTAVAGESSGLMIANQGLPEVEVFQSGQGQTEIAITLLRCVGWLSRDDHAARRNQAGPCLATPGAQLPGLHSFRYAVIPFTSPGNEPISLEQLPYEQAYAFSASLGALPLRSASTGLHAGELPARSAIVSISPRSFILSALKRQEDGPGWILRGYNILSQTITASVTPWRAFQSCEQVNLAEKTLTQVGTTEGDVPNLVVGGHKVVTLRFSA